MQGQCAVLVAAACSSDSVLSDQEKALVSRMFQLPASVPPFERLAANEVCAAIHTPGSRQSKSLLT